jgi:hypothetical protein
MQQCILRVVVAQAALSKEGETGVKLASMQQSIYQLLLLLVLRCRKEGKLGVYACGDACECMNGVAQQ